MSLQQFLAQLIIEKYFHSENLPRNFSKAEIDLLGKVFPGNSEHYTSYYNLLKNWYICKIVQSDPVKLYLCPDKKSKPDYFMMPVFTLGGVNTSAGYYEFVFFENNGDTILIEYSFSGIKSREDYSIAKWLRGEKSPFGGELRLVEISSGKIFFVLDVDSKKIWIHDSERGINFVITVTSFYNMLMASENIKDPNTAFNFSLLFGGKFNNEQIRRAGALYIKSNPGLGITIESEKIVKRDRKNFWKRLF